MSSGTAGGARRPDAASPIWPNARWNSSRSNRTAPPRSGFGNVGSVTAYTMARRMGMKMLGVSDHTAAYYDPMGLV